MSTYSNKCDVLSPYNSRYSKKIEVTDTGMIIASVYRPHGKRVALRFLTSMFNSPRSIERRGKRAHAWADKMIKVLERVETV